jgi:hypothetical protein
VGGLAWRWGGNPRFERLQRRETACSAGRAEPQRSVSPSLRSNRSRVAPPRILQAFINCWIPSGTVMGEPVPQGGSDPTVKSLKTSVTSVLDLRPNELLVPCWLRPWEQLVKGRRWPEVGGTTREVFDRSSDLAVCRWWKGCNLATRQRHTKPNLMEERRCRDLTDFSKVAAVEPSRLAPLPTFNRCCNRSKNLVTATTPCHTVTKLTPDTPLTPVSFGVATVWAASFLPMLGLPSFPPLPRMGGGKEKDQREK